MSEDMTFYPKTGLSLEGLTVSAQHFVLRGVRKLRLGRRTARPECHGSYSDLSRHFIIGDA